MTNVIKHRLIYFLASVILFSSCQKPADSSDDVPRNNTKLVKIKDETSETNLTYNADGTLKSLATLTGEPVTYNLSYDANKRITELSNSAFATIRYTYTGSQLTHTETMLFNKKTAYSDYTYNNGKLTRISAFIAAEDNNGQPLNIESLRTEFTYNTAGDVSETSAYMHDPLTGQLKFAGKHRFISFDTKKNPAALFGTLAITFFAEPHTHNIVKEQVYDEDGILTSTIDYTYTYNANGYPTTIKEKETPVSGAATETTSHYTYQ